MLKQQQDVARLKQRFTELLCETLQLTEVQAPLMVPKDSGVQDNLSGTERAVAVHVKAEQRDYEIVHSLAKWKRSVLAHYGCQPGEGIVAQMKAIRADEERLTERHSVLVEQWDWERVIQPAERSLDTLKATVRDIYQALRALHVQFSPEAGNDLASEVVFIHAEQLRRMFPQLSPKQREYEITKLHKAVFLIGIGGELADGMPHDDRAADYDDWSTQIEHPASGEHFAGLNGDLLVWHEPINDALELSSMGIRVNSSALEHQVALRKSYSLLQLPWHQQLLNGELPECIGGGIGQSRVAMWVLQLAHISATQAPQLLWPQQLNHNHQRAVA
ncbi:aspartate--ammonia ligase [Pseudidiomarina woesei]|uniref:Aspartate--ammonia ligase n=1 Tax=Pseudidiomarina woesei TaxID=1381080 RepID=A0A0K6HA48_9GAMM|nr:aspartate--ammonia ligase [Pseudidiomarina woesei]CUA87771.1 aspartate-ammonia ligase [Pseudidiomarina woesei]